MDNKQNISYGTCKINDGLYIGDENAAKVSYTHIYYLGFRIYNG